MLPIMLLSNAQKSKLNMLNIMFSDCSYAKSNYARELIVLLEYFSIS